MESTNSIVPVALFVFNRHKQLQKTLDCLRSNNIHTLYVFADGARNSDDMENIERVREIIDLVDWVDVKKFYSEQNMGLSNAIKSGLNRVFSDNDKAIIIEDDICVAPGFYDYVSRALYKYENDRRIFGITGLRYPFNRDKLDSISDCVFLAKRFCSWGWATWADRWEKVSFDKDRLLEKIDAQHINLNAGGADLPLSVAALQKGELTGAWDIYCFLNMLINAQYFVWPKFSLVENTGLDEGTHVEPGSKSKWKLEWEANELDLTKLPSRAKVYNGINNDFLSYLSSLVRLNQPSLGMRRLKRLISFLAG